MKTNPDGKSWIYGTAAALALAAFLCGCAAKTTPHSPGRGVGAADYVPSFPRYHEGYLSRTPLYSVKAIYLDCEGLDGGQMADIQEHFVRPLTNGDRKYAVFIGAVVITAVQNEWEETTFTIWLLDGRRLDSGYIFARKKGNSFIQTTNDDLHMGGPMYARAMQMMRKAIPASTMNAARHVKFPGPQADARPVARKGVLDDDYVPFTYHYHRGYRAGIPLYSAEADFFNCEGFDARRMADIQEHFVSPFTYGNGEWAVFFGDVVINGVPNKWQDTTFTIWLLDGRCVNSGPIFTDKSGKQISFDDHKMGAVMYARAIQMMKKEIPAWKLKAGENAAPDASDPY